MARLRIRFHLDENVDRAVAEGLERRGIGVTTTQAGLLGVPDEAQLEFATARGRVLFTHDADLLRLNQAGARHSGIAYCRKGSRSIGTNSIQPTVLLVDDPSKPWEVNPCQALIPQAGVHRSSVSVWA